MKGGAQQAVEHYKLRENSDDSLPQIRAIDEESANALSLVHMEEITQVDYNNMQRLFEIFDTNKSGTVDTSELSSMMNILGIPLTQEEAELLVQDMTRKEDGVLGFDDFVTMLLRNKHLISIAKNQNTRSAEKLMKDVRKKKTKGCYMPDDPWRWAWDSLMLLCILYFVVSVPILALVGLMHVKSDLPRFFYVVCDFIGSGIFLIDIRIQFYTCFTDGEGNLISNLRVIKHIYMRSWFIPDVLATIPIDTVLHLLDFPRMSVAFSMLRLLRMFTLHRLFRSSERDYVVTAHYIRFNYYFVPILLLIWWSMAFVHWASVVAMALGVGEPPEGDTTQIQYVNALYWIGYTISTCGYGDVPILTVSQRLYASLLFLISLLINGIVLAKMADLFRDKSLVEEARHRMRETLALLRHFNIPNEVLTSMLSFQNHLVRQNLTKSYADVIASLPHAMQSQLALYMRISVIKNVPLFQEASDECKIELARRLKGDVRPPEEFIIIVGEEGRAMFFLMHGFAEVMTRNGTHVAMLEPGSFMGEIALLMDGVRRTASIRAVTYCDLLTLEKDDFDDILKRFPRFKEIVNIEAQKRFEGAQKQAAKKLEDMEIYGQHLAVAISPRHTKHSVSKEPSSPTTVAQRSASLSNPRSRGLSYRESRENRMPLLHLPQNPPEISTELSRVQSDLKKLKEHITSSTTTPRSPTHDSEKDFSDVITVLNHIKDSMNSLHQRMTVLESNQSRMMAANSSPVPYTPGNRGSTSSKRRPNPMAATQDLDELTDEDIYPTSIANESILSNTAPIARRTSSRGEEYLGTLRTTII